MSKFSSIFSQLLSLFPRSDFYREVYETKAERHSRGFSSWDQFVAMLFCQLGRPPFTKRDMRRTEYLFGQAEASWIGKSAEPFDACVR